MRSTRVEILSIGDELLDGRVADTNTLTLARMLADVELAIAQRTSIPDDVAIIVQAARDVAARGTTLCLVSGGLGPTADDVTALAFATLCETSVVRDDAQAKRITERLLARGRAILDNHLKQAEYPKGATALPNPVGAALGFDLMFNGCRFVALPGVPAELEAMARDSVIKPLAASSSPLQKYALRTFGLAEAEVDARVAGLAERWPAVRVGFRVKFPEIHLTLGAKASEQGDLAEARAFARERLGLHVFSEAEAGLAEIVIATLHKAEATLACAESCTGGLIGDLLTDVVGAGEVFLSGVITYAVTEKQRLLGVHKTTLDDHGAVSEATVKEMAEGARHRASSTYGLATTGIAGPTGGSEATPVGTIWFGLATATSTITRKLVLPFDRRGNKVVAAYTALDMLRRHLTAS